MLPSGKVGRKFIDEVSRLMNKCLQDSPRKDIAFKAIMVTPNLLLQKPSQKSKSKDHLSALERRVEHWESVEPAESLKEDETIQKCLKTSNTTSTVNKISTKFSCNIRTGNAHSAIKLLTDNMLSLTTKIIQH